MTLQPMQYDLGISRLSYKTAIAQETKDSECAKDKT